MLVITYKHAQCDINVIFYIHADIDECYLEADGCTQLCTNTPGSFRCGCNMGYQLISDNKSCAGMYITMATSIN